MKLREMLDRIDKKHKWYDWLLAHVQFINEHGQAVTADSSKGLSELTDDDVGISSYIDELHISADSKCPIPKDAWGRGLGRTSVEYITMHNKGMKRGSYNPGDGKVDINLVPKAWRININGCEIINFKAKNLADMEPTKSLVLENIKTISCSLLPLLRWNLETINADRSNSGDVYEAMQIIEAHLDDKDLVACQNELIDAGFERWA